MRTIKINPLARAIGTFGAVAALATGITFAAFSSSVTLTNSQFSTATADLKIWDGDSYESTATGFNFTNVVPGVETAPFTFWLKNFGGVPLDVTSVSDNAAIHNGISDPSQVEVKVTNVTSPETTTFALSTLWDVTPDDWPGNQLDAGEEDQYTITVKINNAAVSGSSASLTNLNLTFTGTQP